MFGVYDTKCASVDLEMRLRTPAPENFKFINSNSKITEYKPRTPPLANRNYLVLGKNSGSGHDEYVFRIYFEQISITKYLLPSKVIHGPISLS